MTRVQKRMLLHLPSHEVESVGSGGCEMFLETSFIDEAHVCGEDVFRCLIGQCAHEESDHALGDDGVGVGEVAHFSVFQGGFEPNLRLAASDEPILGLQAFVHGGELFSQSNDIFISLGPILKEIEFIEELERENGQLQYRETAPPARAPRKKASKAKASRHSSASKNNFSSFS